MKENLIITCTNIKVHSHWRVRAAGPHRMFRNESRGSAHTGACGRAGPHAEKNPPISKLRGKYLLCDADTTNVMYYGDNFNI